MKRIYYFWCSWFVQCHREPGITWTVELKYNKYFSFCIRNNGKLECDTNDTSDE